MTERDRDIRLFEEAVRHHRGWPEVYRERIRHHAMKEMRDRFPRRCRCGLAMPCEPCAEMRRLRNQENYHDWYYMRGGQQRRARRVIA